MNQEEQAIALLEKVDKHIIHHTCGYTVTQDLKTLKDYVRQAVTLLKQQPAAGDFTKKFRILLATQDRTVVVRDAYKACDRLDRAASTNKDLLAACKDCAATFVGLQEGSIGWQAMKKVEAAISKAKKEEETK